MSVAEGEEASLPKHLLPLDTLLALTRSQLFTFFQRTSLEDLVELRVQMYTLFPQLEQKITFGEFRDNVRFALNSCIKQAITHPHLARLFWQFCFPAIEKWRPKLRKPKSAKRTKRS